MLVKDHGNVAWNSVSTDNTKSGNEGTDEKGRRRGREIIAGGFNFANPLVRSR